MDKAHEDCVDILTECDQCLSRSSLAILYYLLSTLPKLGELKNEGPSSIWRRLGENMDEMEALSYILYALEYANCYQQRQKLRQVSGISPKPIPDDRFHMREQIVVANNKLKSEEFSKLVNYIIAAKCLPTSADRFSDDDPASRMNFFALLENQQVITVKNYREFLGKALQKIGRRDIATNIELGGKYWILIGIKLICFLIIVLL